MAHLTVGVGFGKHNWTLQLAGQYEHDSDVADSSVEVVESQATTERVVGFTREEYEDE